MVFGIGFGFVNAPITNAAVSGMPRAQAGVASAIASTSRQVGSTLGVAVVGALRGLLPGQLPGRSTPASATHAGWWVLAGCGLVVLVLGQVVTTGWARGTADRTAQAAQPEFSRAEPVHRWTVAGTPRRPARRAWSAMCDLVLDNERRREVSDALGLTFGRVRALRRIARHPMTMGELAANARDRRPLRHPGRRRVGAPGPGGAAAPPDRPSGQAGGHHRLRDRPRPGGPRRSWGGLPVGLAGLSRADMETLARILESARTPGPQGHRGPDGSTRTKTSR